MDEWRIFLYPLGFLSGLAFGARFIIQWLQSEKAKQSIVTRSFWKLSLVGNLLLMLHSFIQVQFHVCLIQACNAVISWRNLNLMQTRRPPISFVTVLGLLTASILITCLVFAIQESFFINVGGWFRIPVAPWQTEATSSVPIAWHAIGTLGYLLFSSRFWIQWWQAERSHASVLPRSFWYLSLAGAVLSIFYFIRIADSVNLIGPLIGIIPYVRNLMLINKAKKAV